MKQQKDLVNDVTDVDRGHAFSASEDFQLGDAYVKPSLNRIEMGTSTHQVEPKVMQVLLMLCARPGHVVHREQLLQQVWAHTGDDYLLNRAVSELRKIFADSAQNPHYIETIRKTGYRLLAAIKPIANAALVSSQKTPEASQATDAQAEKPVGSSSNASQAAATGEDASLDKKTTLDQRYRPWLAAALAVCLGALALFGVKGVLFQQDHDSAPDLAGYQVYPVTSLVGREYEPALSPDGTRITYVVDDALGGSTIFVKMLQGEKVLALSKSGASARFPKWTPDGQQVVYANLSPTKTRIVSVSPMGGSEQTLFIDNEVLSMRGMNISPNGQQLVYSKRSSANAPHQIWLLSIPSGEIRQLTFPKLGTLGDIDPLFTPDGQSLVFVRGNNEVTKDIYQLNLREQETGREEITRLTFDNRKINGVTWSPEGSHLLFTSTRSGMYRLWSIDKNGSEPKPFSLGMETVQRPTSVVGVDAIVFEDWKHRAKLMSVSLSEGNDSEPAPLLRSTRWDSNPSVSPDGNSLVFASDRGGPYSIWRSELDGSALYQWINLGGAFMDNPAWSPDGTQVVFDASPNGNSQLFIMLDGGSKPTVLPVGSSDNRNPEWSRDGKWVYFESNRTGNWNVYAWRVGSDEVRELDIVAGQNPQESVDGQWILFTSDVGQGIWRCRKEQCLGSNSVEKSGINGEVSNVVQSEALISEVQAKDSSNWVPATSGIYFIRRVNGDLPKVAFFEYATGSIKDITELSDNFVGWGMMIDSNETHLFYSESDIADADIRIARP